MPETQGRGDWFDETRIEQAVRRAHEAGGDASSVQDAARREFGQVTSPIIEAVRRKMRELFG